MWEYQPANQAKNVVRYVQSTSLRATSAKQEYGVQNEFWYLIQRPKSSWCWRAMCRGAEVIEKDREWEVGNGECIDAVNERWFQGKSMVDLQATIKQNMIQPGAVVADLMAGKGWSNRALNSISPIRVREKIRTPILKAKVEDKQWWHGVEVEKITFKHVYNCLKENPAVDGRSNWRWI